MSTAAHCPQCGTPLLDGSLQGLCPRCVARQAADILASRARPAPPEPARLRYFGDYELLEEIARGGMGVVWKARQVSLNRIVAVKMLLAGKFSSPEFIQRFRTEAEAAANLQHPNIGAIHEVGEHEGQSYFSMDYVEGPNLAQLARDQPLASTRAAALLRTIAEAVHYAHQRGVIHRDLKPSNVLLDAHGQPRVTDFGLAKFVAADVSRRTSPCDEGDQRRLTSTATDLTITGQVLGTPSFMPPEQAGGRRGVVTVVSDIYSLGAILYFLLTGRAPFAADSLEETLRQVHELEPVSPRLLNPAVPRDLETISLKCLEKEPHKRYGSAHELAEELGRFLSDEPIRARPVSPAEKLWRWCRRKPALATALVALLLVGAVGLAGILWQWRRAEGNAVAESRQRQQAEANDRAAQAEAVKSRQVSQFLKDMLSGINPDTAQGRDTTLLREILAKAEARLAVALKGLPDTESELRHTIGTTYQALGEPAQAEAMHRLALRLRTELYGARHLDTLNSMLRLSQALQSQFRETEAAPLAQRALELQLLARGENHPFTVDLLEHTGSFVKYRAETEVILRRSLAIQERLGLTNELRLGLTLRALAVNLNLRERHAEALAFAQQTLDTFLRLLPPGDRSIVQAQQTVAEVLIHLGRLDEAAKLLDEVEQVYRTIYGENDPRTVNVWLQQGRIEQARDRKTAVQSLAERSWRAVLSWTNDVQVASSLGVIIDLATYYREEARINLDQGQQLPAREAARHCAPLLRRLVAAQETVGRTNEWWLAVSRSHLGCALVAVAATDFEAPLAARLATFEEAERLLRMTYDQLREHPNIPLDRLPDRLEPSVKGMMAVYAYRARLVLPDAEAILQLALWAKRWADLEEIRRRSAAAAP